MTVAVFSALLARDLKLAARRPVDALLPLGFFAIAASLFPLGVGPEPGMLLRIAPGVLWVCALLAAMLSVTQMYASDYGDGSLEQILLAGESAASSAYTASVAKATAHWLLTGLPLLVGAPLLGMMFGLTDLTALCAGLALGTPVLSLLGGLGAALTLGVRNGGVLLVLLILPLCIPMLIFGSGVADAVESGTSARGEFSLLAALLIAAALCIPFATGAALRIATE